MTRSISIDAFDPHEVGRRRTSWAVTPDQCDDWVKNNTFFCKKMNANVSRESCKNRKRTLQDHQFKNGFSEQQFIEVSFMCLDCKRVKV